ncbi:MAG: AtpZ/AtpI family protein [Fimbriimonadales bacterium]|nr:AtpZ/AtpI family protein [Fimbriimonadales bacterium]
MNDSNSAQRPDREGEASAEPKQPYQRDAEAALGGEAEPLDKMSEPQGDESEPYQMPELPPVPELPKPPDVRFERPRLGPSRSPRFMEASHGTAIAFSVGFALAGPILVGALLGVWLDNRFNTAPWLTLILLLVGIVAGFTQMIRLLNRLQNEQERKP